MRHDPARADVPIERHGSGSIPGDAGIRRQQVVASVGSDRTISELNLRAERETGGFSTRGQIRDHEVVIVVIPGRMLFERPPQRLGEGHGWQRQTEHYNAKDSQGDRHTGLTTRRASTGQAAICREVARAGWGVSEQCRSDRHGETLTSIGSVAE